MTLSEIIALTIVLDMAEHLYHTELDQQVPADLQAIQAMRSFLNEERMVYQQGVIPDFFAAPKHKRTA
jgi:hypothetical protein